MVALLEVHVGPAVITISAQELDSAETPKKKEISHGNNNDVYNKWPFWFKDENCEW